MKFQLINNEKAQSRRVNKQIKESNINPWNLLIWLFHDSCMDNWKLLKGASATSVSHVFFKWHILLNKLIGSYLWCLNLAHGLITELAKLNESNQLLCQTYLNYWAQIRSLSLLSFRVFKTMIEGCPNFW